MTDTVQPYRFIAAERSYFSGKVRPALRAKRLYFEEVLPTPAAMAEIKQRTGLHYIPIVVTPENETRQDTSDILDALDVRIPSPALIPATPLQRVVSYLIELYADEFMLLPPMHYRWSTPEGKREAADSFIAASGDRDAALELAKAMSRILGAWVKAAWSWHSTRVARYSTRAARARPRRRCCAAPIRAARAWRSSPSSMRAAWK